MKVADITKKYGLNKEVAQKLRYNAKKWHEGNLLLEQEKQQQQQQPQQKHQQQPQEAADSVGTENGSQGRLGNGYEGGGGRGGEEKKEGAAPPRIYTSKLFNETAASIEHRKKLFVTERYGLFDATIHGTIYGSVELH